MLREHAPRIEHEVAQEVELGAGQLDARVAAEDLVPLLVEREVGEMQHVAGQLALRAAENRLHARDDLGEAERLRDVVVAADPQRLHLVLDRVLRGEEEDRRLEPALSHAPAHLDPVQVGEHPVEHDEIGLALGDGLERLPSSGRLVDLESLVPERGCDGVDDRRLVVHDEDALSAHEVSLPSNPVSRL